MSQAIEQLVAIMAQLRDPDSGCPWDKKQTFASIVPHTIEETYEVVDAIQRQDWKNLQEELGDLLFQVIFYSQLASEQGLFDFEQVVDGINKKLIRRHPHVFSDSTVENEDQLNQQWEAIKQQEKGEIEDNPTVLATVPQALPALLRAYKLQKRCAKFGFDWDSLGPVFAKVAEELDEVREEALQVHSKPERVADELGDLFFSVVNLSRHLGHHPDMVLGQANQKFVRRFTMVEQKVRNQGKEMSACSLAELDALWDEVKLELKNSAQ